MNKKTTDFLVQNMVVFLFVILCIAATYFSKQPLTFVVSELFTRIARNSFIVLSLIIPVIAGMGLNFGIVIGAMAAQLAIFLTTYWGFTGISGFLFTAVLATPFAVFFGFLVGKLFNYMKGNEMIGGLVLGYFADGIYQLVFLFIFGGVIKMNNPTLMIPTGVGVKNTIDLKDTVKYALDTVPMLTIVEIGFYLFLIILAGSTAFKLAKKQDMEWKSVGAKAAAAVVIYGLTFIGPVERFLSTDRLLLLSAVELWCLGMVLWQLFGFVKWKFKMKKDKEEALASTFNPTKATVNVILTAVVYGLTYVPSIYNVLLVVRLPVLTYLCIGALCCFNNILMKIFSTVLASWGQLIFLQNVGTISTYGAHTQVGQFAIAALLVGGASVQKATNKQALLGIVLFHTLFIVSPLAGKELFGDPVIGEYFRVFVSYGVIALALAMHAWKKAPGGKKEEKKASA